MMKTTDVILLVAVLVAVLVCLQSAPVTKQEIKADDALATPKVKADTVVDELKHLEDFVKDTPKATKTEETKVEEILNSIETGDVEDNETPADITETKSEPEDSFGMLDSDEETMPADVDLTPRAVAEYLLITGDFDGFDLAIKDLLRAKILSPEEVSQYRDEVSWEYEALLRRLVDAESTYLQEFMQSQDPYVMERQRMNSVNPVSGLPLGASMERGPKPEVSEALKKMQLHSMLNQEASLDQLLEGMAEEYYTPEDVQSQDKLNDEEELLQVIELMKEALDEDYSTQNKEENQMPAEENVNDAIKEEEVLTPAFPLENIHEKEEPDVVQENHDAEKELKAVLEQARIKEEKKRTADKKSAEKAAVAKDLAKVHA